MSNTNTSKKPLVGILMGSDSDWPTMKLAADALAEFGIASEAKVISAHRDPRGLEKYISGAAKRGVKIITGVAYQKIDDAGLHVLVDGVSRVIEADTVVICAGQESNRSLFDALQGSGLETYIIGGAKEAVELDAVRAVDESVRVAQTL